MKMRRAAGALRIISAVPAMSRSVLPKLAIFPTYNSQNRAPIAPYGELGGYGRERGVG